MAVIYDKRTGFALCDPDKRPFGGNFPPHSEILSALDSMILSASGWRKVFAADSDEESQSGVISPADTYLSAVMAEVFSEYLIEKTKNPNPLIVLAMDARFTGPAMADAMVRVLFSRGVRLRYLFISAAPEVMAYAGQCKDIDGFIYISASHNPIGHNGVKFGLNTGGVLDGAQAAELISRFRDYTADASRIPALVALTDQADPEAVRTMLKEFPRWKKEAEEVYSRFSCRVISGYDRPDEQKTVLDLIRRGVKASPLGIVAELNGSARTLSVDQSFLEDLGVQILGINDKPRQITHRIVPEGESLNLCREVLEKEAGRNSAYQLGYVPDNDGDRGNLVYLNSRSGRAEILEAQEVFALSVLAELAYLVWSGGITEKTGVAVNGPTSLRIDEIASFFGCTTFRAEVGEANVVNLAREKRREGWQIRILGEGSNGGNITYPAAVRDPLNTLGALLKLLTLRSEKDKPGLFELWCEHSGQTALYREDFDLTLILESLPAYVTTSAYEKRALMQIRTTDQALLKARYEEIFPEEWDSRRKELEQLGIVSWEEWNQEGTTSVCGTGPSFRSGAEKGGLTIRFFDREGRCPGYIWMRGSGTEPVFRVLADWKGKNSEAEEFLLDWHKSIIKRADG